MPIPQYASNAASFFERGYTLAYAESSGWYTVQQATRSETDVSSWEEYIFEQDSPTTFIRHSVTAHLDGSYTGYSSFGPAVLSLLEGAMKQVPPNSIFTAIGSSDIDTIVASWV